MYKDGIRNLIGNNYDRRTCVATPVRIGAIGNGGQGERIYSVYGKSVTLSANGGGGGALKQGFIKLTCLTVITRFVNYIQSKLNAARLSPIIIPRG